MSRFGCLMAGLFLLVVAGFAWLVHRGGIVGAPAPSGPATAPAAQGSLTLPVAGVAAGALTDTWGQARAAGARAHHAIDILAPRGTPVLAAAAGRVEKLFESKDGGHTIYIRRTDPQWVDYYAHLDGYAPDLREGVAVRQGERIGSVGSTGDASAAAPHLHYEIKHLGAGEKWWQGQEINPYPLLAGGR